MPGLVGLVDPAHLDGVTDAVPFMASRLGRGTDSGLRVCGSGPCAMAVDFCDRAYGMRVAADEAGNVAGVNGELFGVTAAASNDPALPLSSPWPEPAAAVLDLYRAHGAAFLDRLHGHFSVAIWDAREGRLLLATDRFGLRPMYFRRDGERIAFGSEIKALLPRDRPIAVDPHGVADFLILGFPLGTRTLVMETESVPPASCTVIDSVRVATRSYWQFRFGAQPDSIAAVDAAADALGDALAQAVSDACRGGQNVDVPLSGGLDSRCLAALATASGHAIRTYTIGTPDRMDIELGPASARVLGAPNTCWTLDADHFLRWIEDAVQLTDGMYNPVDAAILYIARRLPPDTHCVLDGTNSFDGAYKVFEPALARILPWRYGVLRLALRILGKPVADERAVIDAPFLTRSYVREATPLAASSLEGFLEAVPDDVRSRPFDALDYLDQRFRVPRYNMMGTVLLRAYCEVRHPFYDPRVIDVVTRFAPVLRSKEKRVQGRLIHRLNPAVAALTYERTGLPADSPTSRHLIAYAGLAMRRAGAKVIPALHTQPRTAIDFSRWFQRSSVLQEYFRGILLDPRTLSRGYAEPAELERGLARLFQGEDDGLPLIGRMLALELWLRQYVDHSGG